MKALSVCLLIFLGTLSTAIPWNVLDVNAAPSTVDELIIPQYMGRWYQMYGNRFVFSTFEQDNVCVTADYAQNKDGTLSVFNAARLKTPDGKLTTINGTASIPDPSQPGKLSVKFSSVPFSFGAPYWILKLGPVEGTLPDNRQYQYAIVSDSVRLSLFVLARNPEDFKNRFEQEVLTFLAGNGFTGFLNKPVETLQEPDCKYAPLSDIKRMQSRKLFDTQLWKWLFKP